MPALQITRTAHHELVRTQSKCRQVSEKCPSRREHRSQANSADLWNSPGQQPIESGRSARPGDHVFAKRRNVEHPERLARCKALFAHSGKSARAPQRRLLDRWRSVRREIQRHLLTVTHTKYPILAAFEVRVYDGGLARPPGGPNLVRIGDLKASRVELACSGNRIAPSRVGAEACYVHGKDIAIRLSFDYPLGKRQPDSAPLGESGHDAAGGPVIFHPWDWPDQRVSIWAEGEWAVNDLADP